MLRKRAGCTRFKLNNVISDGCAILRSAPSLKAVAGSAILNPQTMGPVGGIDRDRARGWYYMAAY